MRCWKRPACSLWARRLPRQQTPPTSSGGAIDAVVLAAALATESSTCTTWQVLKAELVTQCDFAAGWQSGCRTWGIP